MNAAALDHTANAGLRRYLEPRHQRRGVPPLCRPEDVPNAYYALGTHPDLVERIWEELARPLPVDCRVVFYGTPALMHPASGVVFAFAGGTHTYAMRLPPDVRAEATRAGATRVTHYPAGQPSFDLADVGEEWVFCAWFRDEEAWCLAAFEHAGAVTVPS